MFSNLLKKYRTKKNINQDELAKRLNLLLNKNFKHVNISSWEKGTNPKIEVIQAIAEILEIPVQYLFDDSDNTINIIIEDRYKNFFTYKRNLDNINSIIKKLNFDFETIAELSNT
jgi:transcriptional regulator with XRE-family HTH domain